MDIDQFADEIVGGSKKRADDGFGDLIADSEKWAQSHERRTLQHARKSLDEAWFPNLKATAMGVGADWLSPILRAAGDQEHADLANMLGDAYSQAAEERDSGTVKRALRGVSRSLPTAIATSPAGPAVMIGTFAVQEGDRALTDARQAGMSPGKALGYAAGQGAIEGGIAGVFQLAGMGGVEKTLGRGVSKAASAGLKDALKAAGVTALHELPEELATELSHNAVARLSGVDDRSMDWQTTKGTIQDTVLQTLLTVGAVESPKVAKAASLQKTANEITEQAESGKAPSRKQFADWGFSKLNGKDAKSRLLFTQETAAKIREAGEAKAAESAESPAGDTAVPGVAGEQVSEQRTDDSAMPAGQLPSQAAESPQVAEPVAEPEVQQPAEEPQGAVEEVAPPERALDETSIKNEIVNEIREGRGDTPLAEVPAESQEQWLESASKRIRENPDLPSELVEELQKDPRTISDEETAALQIHYRRLNNQFAAAHEALEAAEASGDGAAVAAAQAESRKILDKIEATEAATKAAGREWGRAGVARQMVLKADYSLGTVVRRMRTANGGNELSAEQRDQAVEQVRRIQELQEKLAESEAARAKQNPEVGVDKAIKETSQHMLDGRPASQWMRSALANRARRLGIHVGGKTRRGLVKLINEIKDRLRAEADRNGIPYRVFLEGVKESYQAIADWAILERTAKDRAHKLTGLSQGDVNRLANNGFDYAADPKKVGGKAGQKIRHFDEYAQEIASEYPALFDSWESPSEILWDLLGKDVPGKIRWDSPRVMEAGVAWAEQNAGSVTEENLPPIDATEVQQDYLGEDPVTPDRTSAAGKKAAAKQKVANAWSEFKAKLSGPREGLIGGESGSLDLELIESGFKLLKAYSELGTTSFAEFFSGAKAYIGDTADAARDTLRAVWDKGIESGIVKPPQIDSEDNAAISRYARKVTRSVVESGITGREEVVDAAHEELRRIDPNITRRQAMDAISGYGQYSELSKEDVDVQIRDIRGQLQQLSKLEDMAAGKAPEKTGVERRTPSDAERQLIAKVNEAKKRGGFDTLDPEKQLKSALDAAKTAVRNRIADLEHEIRTREKIVKERTPLKPDAELVALREELDALRDEHAKIFPKTVSREQKIAATERSLDRAIAQLEADLKAGNIGKGLKPKPVSTPAIDAKRKRLEALRERRQELRDAANPKLSTEEKRTIAYRKSLEKKLADLERRVKERDFTKKPVKKVKPDKESIELKFKIAEAKKELGILEEDLKIKNARGMERVVNIVREVVDTSFSVMTSWDFSAMFRQGAFVTYARPSIAAKAVPEMLKSTMSDKGAFEAMERMKADEDYRLAVNAGLDFTELDGKRTDREEVYRGRVARKYPGVRASGRAYNAFLNSQRMQYFKTLIKTLKIPGQDISLEEAKQIANFVNIATGRGDMGKFGGAVELLGVTFFAPRYVLSRFQLLLGTPMWKGTAKTRKIIAKEYMRATAGYAAFAGLIGLAASFMFDDEDKPVFELNPLSTEFGRIRFGEHIVDLTGGLGSVATLLARSVATRTKMPTGEIARTVGEDRPYGGLTFTGAIGRFAQYKMSPAFGAVREMWTGENIWGDEIDRRMTVFRHFTPLSLGETFTIWENEEGGLTEPKKAAALQALMIIGNSTGRYRSASAERFGELIGKPKYIKGRREDGEEFDDSEKMDQIIRQAKKHGFTEDQIVKAATADFATRGMKPKTIRERIRRIRGRY